MNTAVHYKPPTKGGLEGAHIRCRAVDGLIWQINAELIGAGAFAQPWS